MVLSGGRADAQKAAKDTKTDHELGFCHDPALPKDGARETREKTRKGDERCGLGGHVTSRDPDIERGRDALLRDPAWHVQKRATAIFDLSLRVGPPQRQSFLGTNSDLLKKRGRYPF